MSVLQLRRYQKRDADLDAVAASGVAAAWTSYTPTITAGTGTFTTVSATGRYLLMGKLVSVQMTIVITTNGTAATAVIATLPTTTAAAGYAFAGRDVAGTGKALIGYSAASASTVGIRFYDGTYPGGSGITLTLSGNYEAA